ncbi:hemagglutinin repeat-containing protein, partial [Selenomonas artemidis]
GKKVNMKVGGNLNIESLQEKDDYREKNSSSGFNISASMSGGINTNDPDIAASYSKGKIHSNWKSITGQAGIYAGADGFDIHVKKNTDLKGSVIASEAASDKNTLSTGTLTYGNIENSASYSASSKGLSYRKFASGAYGAGEGYNMKGLTPVLSVPAQGDAASTTKSAIAPGNIDVRENPNQDLSDL